MRKALAALGVSFMLAAPHPRAAHAAPPPVQQHKCPNGLDVLVVENHAIPIFTVEIAVRNGSMTEPPEYNGLSHLYEHMFFKANAVVPNQEAYLARVHELGLLVGGTTNTERVNYFFTTTSDHFKEAMVFMRDAIMTPAFDAKELARERVVVTGELDLNESTPGYHLWHELLPHTWFKYPSRKDPLGSRKTVLAATPEMMRTIQKRYYVPNNSVLVVTGDVKASEVFAEADSLYAKWARTEDPFEKYPLVKHPPLPKSEAVVVVQPVNSYSGAMVWHGPSTVGDSVPATYAADLLRVVINWPSSEFQKHLVGSGACMRADLHWWAQRNTGPISLSFDAAPDRVDACVKAIASELPRMTQPDYLSDEQLRYAANVIENQMIKERERLSEYGHTLTFWWTGAGLDYYLSYVDNLKKVNREAVAKYLDTYVIGKKFVFGSLVSPEMAKDGFHKAHFEELVGLSPAPKPPANANANANANAKLKSGGAR